ncbi:MAG TPA: Uma2 family endonuclease [Isosphaeraceae bacterium]|nr:Uma2 family endonuclease [Isosphaeraceae bacterium]
MATATLPQETSTDPWYRMSLETYRRMGELGLLQPSDRVELLDGILVKKMTKGPRHVLVTSRTFKLFLSLVPDGWVVRKEDPIELPSPQGDSAPEPDIAILRGREEDYGTGHPGPDSLALVVEVADSSLARDRRGLARYARAGIPTVWIVNLNREEVEVYTEPSGPVEDPGYARRETVKVGSTLSVFLDGQEVGPIAVEHLLG